MAQRIGILTAGGDAPGLNTAIQGFGKTAIQQHGWELIGFRDGMRGLAENRFIELDAAALSGILTTGGTMLGTSRDKVHRMMVDGEPRDMVPTIVENCEKDGIDVLVCLGGGGTAKNAKRLMDAGLNVIHLPKTIDNDIVHTDSSFGFATALEIATEAVDRLHSTAHSHHRIILHLTGPDPRRRAVPRLSGTGHPQRHPPGRRPQHRHDRRRPPPQPAGFTV